MKKFSQSYVLKVIFVTVLLLFFLIPLSLIRVMVNERQSRSFEAEQEIVRLWGGRQTIAGPFLAVPYKKTVTETTEQGKKTREYVSYFFITPETLDGEGEMKSEVRKRGIYDIPVYQTELRLTGTFLKPDISELHIAGRDVYWNEAQLIIELPDMRALQAGTKVLWNEEVKELQSGVSQTGIYANNLQGPISDGWERQELHTFRVVLKLRGAGSLYFVPFGKETDIYLKSDWPAPSFGGAFLPDTRETGDEGFTASWSVHALARNFPGMWKAEDWHGGAVLESSFGVELFEPVGLYAMVERSVKYGILFIFLPFTAFFMFEVFSKKRIHILQYLMVGAANTVFYLLLLSLSEHIGFSFSYIIGAAVTSALIVFYSSAVLVTPKQGLVMLPIMTGLYTFLYTMLQSEDYALLIGSAGLFVLLALIMILTRKIDWHGLNRKQADDTRAVL